MEYKDLIGIPFKYGGRDLSGLDCWGLIIEFYRRLGIKVEDPIEYRNEIEGHKDVFEWLRAQDERRKNEWKEVNWPLQSYDLCFFHDNSRGISQHVGIWLPNNRIIHAIRKLGVIISPFRHWKTRYTRAWRNRWLA